MMKLVSVLLLLCVLLAGMPAGGVVAQNPGESPENPIDLDGPISGTLAPGAFCWYRFWREGDRLPIGVALNFAPSTPANNPYVRFSVWVYRNTITGVPRLQEIGRGSVVGATLGAKYWRGSGDADRNYYVQVVNDSEGIVDYAIALTGAAYPPPALAIDPDRGQPPTGATPTPVYPYPFPTETPTPVIESTGGGASAQEAPYLSNGQSGRGKLGPEGRRWFRFNSWGGGKPANASLSFSPVTEKNIEDVIFKVYIFQSGMASPTLLEIGRGTKSGNPFGPKYWRGGADAPRVHFIEVINYNKEETVDFTVTVWDSQ